MQQRNDTSFETTVTCAVCGLVLDASIETCPNDGSRLNHDLAHDRAFEHTYEFCEKIAEGGMGVIYKARHRALNMYVAIKMLQVTNATSVSVQRFQQEAQTLAKLNHPNLVRLFELGVTSYGQPFTVMEFVEGKGLDRMIAEGGRLTLPRALDVFRQVCNGLEYVHARGILHRDLKPSNIMIVETGPDSIQVKLVDFGVAKIMDETAAKSLTQTGEFVGSPLYMSPEQAKGLQLDERSDIYSLGCVMYEMLSGTTPFTARTAVELIMKQVSEQPRNLNVASVGRRYPNALEALIAKMLAKDPEDRFQNVAELRSALQQLLDGHQAWYQVNLSNAVAKTTSLVWPFVVTGAVLALAVVVVLSALSEHDKSLRDAMTRKKALVERESFPEHLGEDAAYSRIVSSPETWVDVSAPIALPPHPFSLFRERTQRYVEEIIANDQKVVQDSDVALIAGFPLTRLSLKRTGITAAAMPTISKITTLETLELEGVKLQRSDIKTLTNLHSLIDIYLVNCDLDDACLAELAQIKTIAHITVNTNARITTGGIEHLISLPNLTQLSIARTDVQNDVGKELLAMPKLTRVILDGTKVSDEILPELVKMPNLRFLGLNETMITDAGLSSFEASKLANLYISNCPRITRRVALAYRRAHPELYVVTGQFSK